MMEVFEISFDGWQKISVTLNWIAILIVIGILLVVVRIVKKTTLFLGRNSITVEEASLGIGNSNITIKFDKRDQEIAYKLWVELSTRKIGILYDEENDVIKEVYDSWYAFFGIARNLLKDIPGNRLTYSKELVDITQKVLNEGLRPHLTKWQAKFRKWYDVAYDKDESKTPQQIQKEYEYYDELIKDLKNTNLQMIEYKKLIHKIAFNE